MLLSGRIESYAEYSQFKTITEFNTSIEMFLADHKQDFSKGELIAFKRLTKYAAKYYGVANAKIGTFVKTINEKLNGYGISRRTFERMIRKAEGFGILVKIHTVKAKGGQGHNVYIFQEFKTNGVPKARKLSHRGKAETVTGSKIEEAKNKGETISLFKATKIKLLNKRTGTAANKPFTENSSLDHTFTSDSVPKEFVMAVKPFFDDKKTIEEYWRMVQIDTYHIRGGSGFTPLLDDETILYTAIHSFKQMIGRLKAGTIKTKPIAYFKGVLNKQITDAYTALQT